MSNDSFLVTFHRKAR